MLIKLSNFNEMEREADIRYKMFGQMLNIFPTNNVLTSVQLLLLPVNDLSLKRGYFLGDNFTVTAKMYQLMYSDKEL